MTTLVDPGTLIEALTPVARRAVPSATLHLDQGDDDYWCLSWRINDQADRELFVEYPGRGIAPDVLRVGVYFRDAPDAIAAAAAHEVALAALTTRRDALAALGAVCTFTPGASTRDDDIFAWATSDLVRWLTGSCANRDLVWRYNLRAGAPSVDHLKSVIHEFAPVWWAWNSLQGSTTSMVSPPKMQMTTYLSFRGQCEEAFKCYEATLGGRVGAIFRYVGTPLASQVPADWQDKVMHGSLTIGCQELMAGDVAPEHYEEPKGFSLSLQMKDTSEAERVFNELARNGRIVMPLEKTFWAARFGMVVDRFGIPWMINCDGSDATAEP